MKQYDLVASSDPGYPLRSGCESYDKAVVMQVEPLILVSEESDMKWTCLSEKAKACLITVGVANKATIKRCMRRMP